MLTVDVLGVCKALYKLQLQHCSLRGRSQLDAWVSIKMGYRSAAHGICPSQSILSRPARISQSMPCSLLNKSHRRLILSRAAAVLFRSSHGQQLCFDPQMTWQSPS